MGFFRCLLLFSALGVLMAAAELTTCAEVRALNREEAAEGRPVRIQGVVTLRPLSRGGPYNFTVDDGAGLWVSPPPTVEAFEFPASLRTGDLVEVIGRTNEGRFSPQVIIQQIRVLGRGEMPPARQATPRELTTGAFDSQRVWLEGVVQAAERVAGGGAPELRLRVRNSAGIFTYTLLAPDDFDVGTLVDARVKLTGVCLTFFNSRRQFLGARLYSNSAADIEVLQPGSADPFSAPREALREVLAFSPGGADLHRRQVSGVVTLASPGRFFYLQDGPAALRVNTRQTTPLAPGDVVEAAGFLNLEHHRGEMLEATFRRVGHQPPPVPVPITLHQAFVREPQTVFAVPQDFDDRLVSIEATFISIEERPGEPAGINLMFAGTLVPAQFAVRPEPEFMDALRPGSVLRVSGVCQMSYSASHPVVDWPQPVAMRLLVRDARDVQVLAASSWWTPGRLLLLLAGVVVLLCAVLAWVALLRRQVAQRSLQLAEEMRARRDAAVEFESAVRERNRLAADLHDTMEQSLTGTAMQIEASQALRESAPGRSEQHLALARQLLTRSREDLRRSIWNLRANPLEKQSLAGALREVAESRGAGLDVRITMECRGQERALPDFVAGNMLLLAQECITNALKHAEPSHIAVLLEFTAEVVVLTVRDDGRGFDPTTAGGPQGGHFGVQGMRERAKRLAGTLEIESWPGRGTCICVRAPLEPRHPSS